MICSPGGVAGGAGYGASDRIGADPVTPGDLAATIFWRFGIDPATEISDRAGRPHRVATGEPIRRLFGGEVRGANASRRFSVVRNRNRQEFVPPELVNRSTASGVRAEAEARPAFAL